MGTLFHRKLHQKLKMRVGSCFLKPPIGTTFGHSSATVGGDWVTYAHWSPHHTSEGTDMTEDDGLLHGESRRMMQFSNTNKPKEMGIIDLDPDKLFDTFWYTQKPPDVKHEACGVKKYHLGHTGPDRFDAATLQDFANLGQSHEAVFRRPDLLGGVGSAQVRHQRTLQHARRQSANAGAGKAAPYVFGGIPATTLSDAIMDPGEQLELPPRAKWTDRMKRRERRMKVLYCLRIFSDEGWDTPWRQPQAINIKSLHERVVQTGWRMPMNTSQAKSFTRMHPPPTPPAAVLLHNKMSRGEPTTTADFEHAMRGSANQLSPESVAWWGRRGESSDVTHVQLRSVGGVVEGESRGRRTWSGSAEQRKQEVRRGAILEPTQSQHQPPAHLEFLRADRPSQNLARPKSALVPWSKTTGAPMPIAGAPARPSGPPRGTVALEIPHWRRPVLMPLQVKAPSKAPPAEASASSRKRERSLSPPMPRSTPRFLGPFDV